MKKINNKGFTLVELLAVIVILIIIVSIAIPTISSSIQRTNQKQEENKKQLILSATELYLSDHRKARTEFYNNDCYIITCENFNNNCNDDDDDNTLVGNKYLTKYEVTHNNELVGKYVIYNPTTSKIEVVNNLRTDIHINACS